MSTSKRPEATPDQQVAHQIESLLTENFNDDQKGTRIFKKVMRIVKDSDFQDPNDLLTTGQTAKRLRVSAGFVRKLCEKGELRFLMTGSHRRIPLSEVEKYLAKRKKESLALLEDLVEEAQKSDLY